LIAPVIRPHVTKLDIPRDDIQDWSQAETD
jgi:hypothetical protein